MEAVNPSTGETIETYDRDSGGEVDEMLDRAVEAFEEWRDRPLREREELLVDLADALREDKRDYAELITREMGKPISQSVAEIERCARLCDHYAEHAGEYLQPERHASPPGTTVETVYDPIGPILVIMPWNFPFWQVLRFSIPYLTAGNVGILKHASNVPGCATAIEELYREVGYPEGAFQTTLIGSDRVDDVIADGRIRAATLTGSGPAGRAVASTAGENVKKTVLELGESDPFVVLDDADIEAAAETGAWARNQNSGQSCIAAKRFVVHDDVYDEFVDRFIDEVESLTVGDPMYENTDVGPQGREDLMEGLHEQVEAGATVELGGELLDWDGSYYAPTVLTDVPEGCPAECEETFGPVAAIFQAPDEAAAVRKANDTDFGLGASIWTEDRDWSHRLAREIDAGCVYVNELVKSDPRVPFGGVNQSGYGRELSEIGIKEFLNRKTVWVN